MRILIYTHEFPPYVGGAGTYVYELAVGLHEIGQEVWVLAPEYEISRHELDEQLPFPMLRQPLRLNVDSAPAMLRSCVEGNFFDVVLVAENMAQRCAGRLNWSGLPPYCITVHGTEMRRHFGVPESRPPKHAEFMYPFFEGASRVLSVSQSTKDIICSYLPALSDRVAVVNSGVNPECFPVLPAEQVERERRRLGITGRRALLCASRVSALKGHDILLGSLRPINEALDDVVLLIAGMGPTSDHVRRLAVELGVQHQVIFLGAVPRSELCRFYNLCDVFTMISSSESFGLVYLEANCCKKAVVAGRTGGVAEAVEDGVSGVLVDPSNPNAVAAAVVDLLNDPERLKRLGEQGHDRVLQGFTHKHVAQNTLRVLQDAC